MIISIINQNNLLQLLRNKLKWSYVFRANIWKDIMKKIKVRKNINAEKSIGILNFYEWKGGILISYEHFKFKIMV